MDPRDRADAILARARARGAFVVTPESAVSPMDAANTLQIPRTVVAANDEREPDPDQTMIVPGPVVHGRHRPVPAQEPHRVDDELPAITQEALTDVVATPPGPRSRQRRLEQHQNLVKQRQQQEAQQQQQQHRQSEPEPEQLDGLVPTVKQPPTTRSTMSQRLDG